MKKTTITIRAAVWNFARKHVARLVAEKVKVCTGRDLSEVVGKTKLSAEEAREWHKDLADSRRCLCVIEPK